MKQIKIFNSPFFNVFLFSLFWSLEIFFAKIALTNGAHPLSFLIQTAFIGLVLISLFLLPKIWDALKNIERPLLINLIFACGIKVVGTLLSYTGLSLTSATNAGFLMKFTLVSTIFLAWVILKEKITVPKIAAAIFMLIGVFLLTTQGRLIVPHLGDLLLIITCFLWSLGNVLIRKFIKDKPIPGEIPAFLQFVIDIPLLIAIAAFSPLYPALIQPVFAIQLFNIEQLKYIIIVGAMAALLTIFLYRTLKIASASYTTMLSMLSPVIVTFLAFFFLGEQLLLIQIIGAVLIILSGFTTHLLKIAHQ